MLRALSAYLAIEVLSGAYLIRAQSIWHGWEQSGINSFAGSPDAALSYMSSASAYYGARGTLAGLFVGGVIAAVLAASAASKSTVLQRTLQIAVVAVPVATLVITWLIGSHSAL